MTSRTRIPTALEPYIRLPPETALILLTGTLGCSVNWLTARFAGGLLGQPTSVGQSDGQTLDHDTETTVIFVNFMRDATFWHNEIKRATGIDATKLAQSGRFTFIDCLHSLTGDKGDSRSVLKALEKQIKTAVTSATEGSSRKVILILDNPDLLLALNLTTAHALNSLILELRSTIYSTVIACCSDSPLLSAATNGFSDTIAVPIEAETAAFVVQQAHNAFFTMSVRELGTGAAEDVSGVLSVTRGGSFYDWSIETEDRSQLSRPVVKELEALYLVQRNGSAKVFERGSSNV